MKKVIFLLLIGVLVMSSCTDVDKRDSVRAMSYGYYTVDSCMYKGHSFLIFRNKITHTSGVTHSPECPKCYQMFD